MLEARLAASRARLVVERVGNEEAVRAAAMEVWAEGVGQRAAARAVAKAAEARAVARAVATGKVTVVEATEERVAGERAADAVAVELMVGRASPCYITIVR